jgi:hypothetical protein
MGLKIGFSKSRKKVKLFSDLIIFWDRVRHGSNLPISHCYGRFTSASWERDFIYQASGHATNFMGEKNFANRHEVIEEYTLSIPRDVVERIGRVCVDREGKPYAIKQTIGIAISAIIWIITFGKIEIKNPFADGDAETNCIEEWGRILAQELNVEPPQYLDGISVKPFRDWIAGLPMARLTDVKLD